MEALIGIVVFLSLSVLVVRRVNARYERAEGEGPLPDDLVQAAWDEFGGDEDPLVGKDRLNRLVDSLDIEALRAKPSLVQLAVMATRADRVDVLPTIAARAEALESGCGETRSLIALSEALTGDDLQRAVDAMNAAQSAVAGCSKCSASIESKLLAQELGIAAQLLEDRMQGDAPVPGTNQRARREVREDNESAPHGMLTVRMISSQ
ncbi:MAG: hypothetical protein Q8Q09_05065 [Deltaproteobacteria bacterium]|nr:hypothetical protein [Deltaproteobacteria bacterium]